MPRREIKGDVTNIFYHKINNRYVPNGTALSINICMGYVILVFLDGRIF